MANFEYLIINQFPGNDSPSWGVKTPQNFAFFAPRPPSTIELRSEIAAAKQRHDQIEASEKVLKGRINNIRVKMDKSLAQFEASRA